MLAQVILGIQDGRAHPSYSGAFESLQKRVQELPATQKDIRGCSHK